MSSTPVNLGDPNTRRTVTTPVRVTVRSSGGQRSANGSDRSYYQGHMSPAHSRELQTPTSMTCMDLPTSRESERWASNAGNNSEVEDEIPEMIAESAQEVRDEDGDEGSSTSEDYGEDGDPLGSYQALRHVAQSQRNSPPGSHQYLPHHHQAHGRYYAPGLMRGQDAYGDSDDEEFEAYEGEEFERYEEEGGDSGGEASGSGGGGMLCGLGRGGGDHQRLDEDDDDYSLSRYHRHLRLYDHMLSHHHHHHRVDGDDDGDDYNEISDVEDEDEDFIPDLLSDHEGEDIGEYISDEERGMDGGGEMSQFHRSNCLPQHFQSGPSPSGSNSHLHPGMPGSRQVRELPRSPHSATWTPSHFRLNSLGRERGRERHARSLDPHGYELRHFTDSGGHTRGADAGKLKSAAHNCPSSPDAHNWTVERGWLHSGLFCATLIKKKPTEEVQKVLEDKEWVYDLLKSLPGVNPNDNGIQGVLAVLRGLTVPAHGSVKAQIPSHRVPGQTPSFSK